MIKKISTYIILIFISFVILKIFYPTPIPLKQPENTTQPTVTDKIQKYNANIYSFDNKTNVAIIKTTSQKITLVPNLDDKLGSSDAKTQYSCNFLVSGGFYTTEGKPIGLMIVNGRTLSPANTNKTFNSFFTVDISNNAKINVVEPPSNANFSIQTGPLIIENKKVQNLAINNDKFARRVVVANDMSGNVYFMVIYDPKSVFSGPTLAGLPNIISAINDDNNLNIINATNLDGGAASSLLSDNLNLTEASPVGSFFCIR